MPWRRSSGTFSLLGLAAVSGLLSAGCQPPAPNSPPEEVPATAPETGELENTEKPETESP